MSSDFSDGLRIRRCRQQLLRRVLNLLLLGVFGMLFVACDAGIRDCKLPSDCFGGELCIGGQCTLASPGRDAQDLDTQGLDTQSNDAQSSDAPGEDSAQPMRCHADDDCDGALVCGDGTCVACTATSGSCGPYSCNIITNECTSTAKGSRVNCQSCNADSECKDAQSRCVPMEFKGARLPESYCLPLQLGNPCYPPYSTPVMRVALSETTQQVYCAPNEFLTTCEALFDVNTQCSQNAQCGKDDYEDGLCKHRTCRLPCLDNDDCSPGDTCVGNLYCQGI